MVEELMQLFRGYQFPMETYRENVQDGGFTQLSLDLTSLCNYRCDWCFNLDLLNQDEDVLSLQEKEQLLRQAKKLGVKSLVIPGTGEPTLDRDFYQLTETAHELGLTTVVYTNLTGNIDKEKIDKLFDHDVSIGVKLDSFDPKYFQDRYHANPKAFDKFRKNLQHVLDTYGGSETTDHRDGTAIEIHRAIANMVLTYENAQEIDKISEFCEENNLPLFVRPVKPVTWARASPEKWVQIGNPLGLQTPGQDLVQIAKHHNKLFSPSSTPENHCAIYSFGLTVKNNGDVQVCPDHHDSRGAFGNVRDKPLAKIIEELNEMRTIKSGFCVMLPDIQHETS
jgi:MoaA/NifB/PqqE/SkfB family radical SAM enzyme